MTQVDTAKLTALIPELESWTGGERRDLDAKIAEVLGWECTDATWLHKEDMVWRNPCGSVATIPHYLGTEPAIATEDMQRLVREGGFMVDREEHPHKLQYHVHDRYGLETGASLPLAWARAVVAKGEQK